MVDHLFIHCSAANLVWNIMKCAFSWKKIPGSVNFLGLGFLAIGDRSCCCGVVGHLEVAR